MPLFQFYLELLISFEVTISPHFFVACSFVKKCGKFQFDKYTSTQKSAGNSNYPNFATESAGNWKFADKQKPKKVREIQIL